MLVTDAQIHVWETTRPDRPWPAVPRNEPHGPNGFSAEQAIAAMDEARVDRAVIVPPTWIGEQNLSALEAAERYPGRFGVMGRFDPFTEDARQRLEGWLKQPNMLGVRLTFFVEPIASSMDNGTLDWFWGAAEELGLPVMAQMNDRLQKVPAIIERHPGLRLIIDHLAWNSGARDPFTTLDDLVKLASSPNVYAKASAMPASSREPFPFRDIEPRVRRVYDAFGPRRMMWGADLTRLECTYAECLNHVREGLGFLSANDREWILGKTAAEALNWPETPPE